MMRKTNLLALVVHLDLIFGMGKKAIRKVIFDTLECDSRILGKCCPWQRHILVLVGGYSRVVRSFFFQLFVIHCCWASGETDRVFCLGKGDSERTNSLTSRNKFIIRRKAFQHVGEVYV